MHLSVQVQERFISLSLKHILLIYTFIFYWLLVEPSFLKNNLEKITLSEKQ